MAAALGDEATVTHAATAIGTPGTPARRPRGSSRPSPACSTASTPAHRAAAGAMCGVASAPRPSSRRSSPPHGGMGQVRERAPLRVASGYRRTARSANSAALPRAPSPGARPCRAGPVDNTARSGGLAPAADHQQSGSSDRTNSAGHPATATAAAKSGTGAITSAVPPVSSHPDLARRRQDALERLHRHVSARDGRRSGRGADRHAHLPAASGRAETGIIVQQ